MHLHLTQVPETWGFSPFQINRKYRDGDIKHFEATNVTACHAACVNISKVADPKTKKKCSHFSWYQYFLVELGRCVLSSPAGKEREKEQGGWLTLPVVLPKFATPLGEYKVHQVVESVGKSLVLCSTKTKECKETFLATNPAIHFSAPDKEATQIYSGLVGSEVLTPLFPGRDTVQHPKTDIPDAYIMESPRKDCQKHLFKAGSSFIGFATSKTDKTIQFYKHDPRLRLLENTLDSPADISVARDSGVFGHSAAEAKCPLVQPNFLNDGKCVRHTEGTCSPLEFTSDKTLKLDRTNLRLWYTTSHKAVLAVDGFKSAESSPCTPLLTSRWRLVPGKCDSSSLDKATQATLTAALQKYSTKCSSSFSSLPEVERSYSSVWGNTIPGTGNARSMIDSNLAWMAGIKKPGEWMQFDFGHVRKVIGAVIQPRKGNSGQYVTKYTVQYSQNAKDWVGVPGNYTGGATGAVSSYFPAPISARFVRLVIGEWVKHPSMRADVIVCRYGSVQNPHIRDVIVSDMSNGTCVASKKSIGAQIQVTKDTCWQHVHPDTLNVYDFSALSVQDCPSFEGDPMLNKINVFTENGSHILQYWDTDAKWKELKKKGYWFDDVRLTHLDYVGRLGDSIRFEDLEPNLQTVNMAKALGVNSTTSTIAFDACGSRAEVANDPLLGNTLFFFDDRCFQFSVKRHPRELDFKHQITRGKNMVFTNVVMQSPDQLRQRVAWALSQIFVLSVKVCHGTIVHPHIQ